MGHPIMTSQPSYRSPRPCDAGRCSAASSTSTAGLG